MIRAVVAACVIAMPQAGWALSCLPHSVENAYLQAAEAEASYVVVQGSLTFDTRKLPKVDYERQGDTPPITRIQALLKGKSLSKSGFTVPYEGDVILDVACYGPWCAQVPNRTEVLVFVEHRSDGEVIATNPCGGFLFSDPTSLLIRKVKACFSGHSCVPLKR